MMGRAHHWHPAARAHFLELQQANSTTLTASSSSTPTSTTTLTTTTLAAATPSSYFTGVAFSSSSSSSRAEVSPLRLTPREESTRVQLQRQRLRDRHKRQSSVSATIPGIKTSAAFFASLRTNLRLHVDSPPPSPISTPNSLRGSAAAFLPPPSPLSVPTTIMDPAPSSESVVANDRPEDPLAGVPELNCYVTTNEEERTDALMLVADSVAQQRNLANNALIMHPMNVAILIGIWSFVVRILLQRGYDLFNAALTCLGILMAALLGCRYASQGYIWAAEKINWEWAGDVDVLVSKFGDEVIGVMLIEWVSGEGKKRGKKAWRGLVKAWTVKLRYRGKGVGVALLEDAVKEAKKKGAESLEFVDDHANSLRPLPELYNRRLDRMDKKAREKLQDLLETSPRGKKK